MDALTELIQDVREIKAMLSELTRPEELMTTNEVAKCLKVHRNYVYKLKNAGMLKPVSPTGHARYRRSEVEFLAQKLKK